MALLERRARQSGSPRLPPGRSRRRRRGAPSSSSSLSLLPPSAHGLLCPVAAAAASLLAPRAAAAARAAPVRLARQPACPGRSSGPRSSPSAPRAERAARRQREARPGASLPPQPPPPPPCWPGRFRMCARRRLPPPEAVAPVRIWFVHPLQTFARTAGDSCERSPVGVGRFLFACLAGFPLVSDDPPL